MPVFSKLTEGTLVITVDGDYTSNEVRRVGAAGLEDPERPVPGPVLVDMSGAAGMRHKSAEQVGDSARFFAEYSDSITRVAIIAPSDLVFGMMNQAGARAQAPGLETRPFRDRNEALSWLTGMAPE